MFHSVYRWLPVLVALAWVIANSPAEAESSPGARQSSGSNVFARDLLRELVEINTTPTNGCTKAAEAMAKRLRAAGFPESDVLLLGPRPDRQNLVARLRGRGKAKPILVIAHLDTVDAPREGWHSDPFRLTERDGFFYGRGVNDVKHEAADVIANLIRLRQEGFMPDRDIVVALTADEETGNANGIAWLLREHRDLLEVDYCLNLDGGGGLPETAWATVLCKVFPGDTPEFVRSSIETALADPKITLTLAYQARPSPVAPLRPEIMEAIERAARSTWPDTPVLPVLAPWSSDSAMLLRAGIPAYGVSAMFCDEQANTHGSDERLPVVSFAQGIDYFYQVLKILAAKDRPSSQPPPTASGGAAWPVSTATPARTPSQRPRHESGEVEN